MQLAPWLQPPNYLESINQGAQLGLGVRRADLEQAAQAQRAAQAQAELRQNWAAKMLENQRMTEQNQLVAQNRADNLSLEGQRNLTTAEHYRALENSAMSGQTQAAALAATTQQGLNSRAAATLAESKRRTDLLNTRAGNRPNPFDLSQFGSEQIALRQNMAEQGKLDLTQEGDRAKLVELQVQQYDIQSQIEGLRASNQVGSLGGGGMSSPTGLAPDLPLGPSANLAPSTSPAPLPMNLPPPVQRQVPVPATQVMPQRQLPTRTSPTENMDEKVKAFWKGVDYDRWNADQEQSAGAARMMPGGVQQAAGPVSTVDAVLGAAPAYDMRGNPYANATPSPLTASPAGGTLPPITSARQQAADAIARGKDPAGVRAKFQSMYGEPL